MVRCVAGEVRKAISERRDRLFLKLRQHIVKNGFYVIVLSLSALWTRCWINLLPQLGQVCTFCSTVVYTGDHDTRLCKAKHDNDIGKMKCANYEQSAGKEDKRHAKTHPVSSGLCPYYVNARARLMETTSGVTSAEKMCT